MTPKSFLGLAMITALALVTAIIVNTRGRTGIGTERAGQPLFTGIAQRGNDLATLAVRDGEKTFKVVRKDKQFVAADSGYPVKTEAVRELVGSLASLAIEEAKTADPARHADLDLASPAKKDDKAREIVLEASNGATLASLIVGKRDYSVGGSRGGTYVRIKDDNQTWLVRGEVKLPYSANQWHDTKLTDLFAATVVKVNVSGGGKEAVTLTRAEGANDMTLAGLPAGKTADTSKIGRLAGFGEGLSFEEVRKAQGNPPKAGDTRRLVLETRDGVKLTVVRSSNEGDPWARISAEGSKDAAKPIASAISAKVDGYEFRLTGAAAEQIGWAPADLHKAPQG